MTAQKKKERSLCTDILLPVIGGSITGWLANRKTQEQYKKLEKPSFSPPPAIFPIDWTSLYALMGYAKHRAVKYNKIERNETKLLTSYELQLGLNYIWSFLFFKWKLRGMALIEMAALLAAICITAYEFFQADKTAGLLLTPYIGWVSFAMALNYSIWQLNR